MARPNVILFLVAVVIVVVVVVLRYLITADFNCPWCGHLNAEHYHWLLPCRCRTCNRWCLRWMG
jgi:hypothetical protein